MKILWTYHFSLWEMLCLQHFYNIFITNHKWLNDVLFHIFAIVHSSLKIKSRPFIITCLNDVSRNKSKERCRIEILCPRLFGCIIFLLVQIFLPILFKNELISLFHFLCYSLWYITCLIFFPFQTFSNFIKNVYNKLVISRVWNGALKKR